LSWAFAIKKAQPRLGKDSNFDFKDTRFGDLIGKISSGNFGFLPTLGSFWSGDV
jgi:hypothetical protein